MPVRSIAVAATVASLAAVLSSVSHAQDSPILSAMRDELKRSMAELRFKDEPPPYYIDYEIEDTSSSRTIARLGAFLENSTDRSRTLRVDVRVGDYSFDNSRFVLQGRGGGGGVVPISADGSAVVPLDDNYDALRRQIWIVTDAAYKRAVNVFARKKAAFQNRASVPTLPDFSRETPIATVLPQITAGPINREWVDRIRELSLLFGSSSRIDNSDVWLSQTGGTRYYLNSEGFTTVTPIQLVSLRVTAEAQADDGMALRDGFRVVEKSLDGLPPMAELSARVREVARRLTEQRVAPIGEEFTGPVLIEGQASAEFVAETLVPLMLAHRPPDVENVRFAQPAQATPFLSRIGLRVLSDAFSVSDTPSLERYDGMPVAGAYLVDDEGMRANDVTLVEKGRLVTLLTGRTPQKNLPHSNGHGRGDGVQAGVFQVRSTQAVPASELRKKYFELLKVQDKAFGYIVRAIADPNDLPGGGPGGGPALLDVIKVTPAGKEELVRGIRLAPVPSTAFRDLVDASNERVLYSYRAGGTSAVSVIVPNLLFEELEIERTRDILQKPPVTPSPLGD